LADGCIYHVLNRGNGRQRIFHKDGDFAAFAELLGQARSRHPLSILGYCLIQNHFHLLLKIKKGVELSCFMQWLLTSHVRRYHRHYRSSGHVWQGRYKSFIVKEDNCLLTVARYIEGNPVRARLVTSAKEWPWSSHRERCDQLAMDAAGAVGTGSAGACPPRAGNPSILSPLPVPFHSDWTTFVDAALTQQELDRLQQSVDRQARYGDSVWQEKMVQILGLESTIRPRGRPAKQAEK
jgi:putative transposase